MRAETRWPPQTDALPSTGRMSHRLDGGPLTVDQWLSHLES